MNISNPNPKPIGSTASRSNQPDDLTPDLTPDEVVLDPQTLEQLSSAVLTTLSPAPPIGMPVLATGTPVLAEDDADENADDAEDEADDDSDGTGSPVRYRGATNDPIFGFLIAIALAIGLSPMISEGNSDLRYTLSWGVLAIFGVLAWLFGDTARISEETPDTAIWGISFGLILGAPLLAFGGETLRTAVGQLFIQMSMGTVLAYLVFVMPLAETLFFRGILQQSRPFWAIGLMGTVWSVVLFVPLMNLREYPVVAFIIVLTLLMMNMMYSYVRQRNGLAAAWICQIVVNLVLVFLPFLG